MSETGLLGSKSPAPKLLGKPEPKSEVEYPDDHVPGMEVPKGGSSCASCEYLKDAKKKLCGNEYFVKWNGSEVIPGDINAYCSDWYEPRGK